MKTITTMKICQLTPMAALPVKPTKWPTITWSMIALQAADDVLQHRRPGELPDGRAERALDDRAVELLGRRTRHTLSLVSTCACAAKVPSGRSYRGLAQVRRCDTSVSSTSRLSRWSHVATCGSPTSRSLREVWQRDCCGGPTSRLMREVSRRDPYGCLVPPTCHVLPLRVSRSYPCGCLVPTLAEVPRRRGAPARNIISRTP